MPDHRSGTRFRDELRDFWRFIRRPRFGPRLPGRRPDHAWLQDWLPSLRLGRLLKWAGFLWFINLVFLGPIAVMAAGAGGATHRLDIHHIPWLQAVLWAPIVEELVFRYGLRRPWQAWWVVPLAAVAMFSGPKGWTVVLLGALLAVLWWPNVSGWTAARQASPWHRRIRYRRWFPWVFHAACLAFAAVHLYNFKLHHTPLWLMPLLVLPQWLTGMVLGWIRVKRGIGASMLLHGIFNGGPLLLVWLALRWAPDLVS